MLRGKGFIFLFGIFFLTAQPAIADDLLKSLGGIKKGLGNIITNKSAEQETAENKTTNTTEKKSKEDIKPFGGLEWTDDFVAIAEKINGFEGIEKIELVSRETTINIKGVNGKSALSSKLSELLKKENPRALDPKKADRAYLSENLGEYLGPNGEKRIVVLATVKLNIKASPVIIAGVPFDLSVTFALEPGLELKKPDSVLVEKRMTYAFPLVVSGISLHSDSFLLLKDKCPEIIKILAKKYANMRVIRGSDGEESTIERFGCKRDLIHFENGRFDEDAPEDEKATSSLIIESHLYDDSGSFSMKYGGGDGYRDELSGAYKKHLTDLESKKFKGKKDMGSDL